MRVSPGTTQNRAAQTRAGTERLTPGGATDLADDVDDAGIQVGSIDERHLLLVGAGHGLGQAIARRFAEGGYRVTLLARSADRLG